MENISSAVNHPPLVTRLHRFPQEPRSNENVSIVARIEGGATSVTLRAELTNGVQSFTMRDTGSNGDAVAGDGYFTAVLPPQPHDTAVSYWIEATSAGGTRRSPLETDPQERHGYYVNNNQPPSPLPVFHFLVPASNPRSWIGGLSCNSYSTMSFAFRGDLYYEIDMRRRGGSVCGSGKPYLKLRFHKGNEFRFSGNFKGHKNLNFQSLYTDKALVRENMAWTLFEEMGRARCSHEYVRCQANGDYYGLYAALERPDSRFLERNGLNPDGDLYKATASREEVNGTYEKKTNEHLGDAELRDFLGDMHNTSGTALVNFFRTRSDEDAIIDYQASQILINNRDYPHKNHYLYQDTATGLWWPTGWDLDLSYGKRWDGSTGGVFNDAMDNPGIGPWYTTRVDGGGIGNHLFDRFFFQAGTHYRRAYLIRLWIALQERYTLPFYNDRIAGLHPLLFEEQFDDIEEWGRTGPFGDPSAPPDFESNLDRVRSHINSRRNFLMLELRRDVAFSQDFPRLKITEIHYNPFGDADEGEFLELWNNSGRAIDISGWSIDGIGDAVTPFVFPSNTVVAQDEIFIVAKDPVVFSSIHGTPARIFGPFAGKLSNEGDTLRVRDAGPGHPATVDFVRYGNDGEWPFLANGFGSSLELTEVDETRDNNLGRYWEASATGGGSPGVVLGVTPGVTFFRRADINGDAAVDISDAFHLLRYLFELGPAPQCLQAADANGNADLELGDPMHILNYLFVNGPAPAAPLHRVRSSRLGVTLGLRQLPGLPIDPGYRPSSGRRLLTMSRNRLAIEPSTITELQ